MNVNSTSSKQLPNKQSFNNYFFDLLLTQIQTFSEKGIPKSNKANSCHQKLEKVDPKLDYFISITSKAH